MASDSYNTSTGVLTISKVAVGDTLYSDVKATIGQVLSVGTSATDSYDTYTVSTNRLAIPVVVVGSTSYYNVVVTLANVLSVGSSCTGIAVCTGSGTSTVYSAPASFESAIGVAYQASSLSAATGFSKYSRFLVSDAATASTSANYLSVGSTYSASAGYAVESGTLGASSSYNSYLTKLLRASAPDSYGYFRLDSHLHPNNALDFDASDANTLKFRNIFGKVSSYYGYLTFAYDNSTKLLQAKKRYTYSTTSTSSGAATTYTGSWTEDSSFASKAQDYYVSYTNGVYKLVASASAATRLYLYNSPLDFGVPTAMNPLGVSFVSNAPAPFLSKTTVAATEGVNGTIYKQVNATYRSQVLTAGADATTKTNAEAMLESIKTTVEAAGESLRYSTTVYKTFRDAALATRLVSDSIADGAPGQNLVPYVYFTNEKDSAGKYHPMMVVVSYGNQASPNGLVDVPHPPGDGSGGYPQSKVTRFSNLENYIFTIPMKNYGQVKDVTENTLSKTLWSDMAGTSAPKDVYSYADTADNGLLFNGAVTFPAFNNTLTPSHMAGELSANGCHVGQGGGGPHCHMDGYQSGFGLTFYNDADYVGKLHPPLIGFGYDGIALFARYRTGTDKSMYGYSTALDGFGAHDHDAIGYHYHAHTVDNFTYSTFSGSVSMPVLMKGAYIGKTNDIPFFRTNSSFANNKYMGGTVK